MKPVFIDFHIHTSNNPEEPNENYDIETLKDKIEELTGGSEYLISLTDHNFINKPVYLKAKEVIKNLLLGVELHIRNYDVAHPYHCHILFKLEDISEEAIDDLNNKLDALYPRKVVSHEDPSIPRLEFIMNTFDKYEFILLPHGGQNHSTFQESIPSGVQFDKTLERSIYYNHFDGFTARSNRALDKTHDYFTRLGINDFVNLVTATDNYEPSNYPNCKAGRDASAFIPTWMLAQPTFNGLRLSLSESSRLVYGDKPDLWSECIQHASLKESNIDIEANFTPGLNVVIGGSSSGKSLLVDSVYRKIVSDFEESVYSEKSPYEVENITVLNPAGQHPYYFDQSYISKVCDPKDKDNQIDSISILKSVFPSDSDERLQITNGLTKLESNLSKLIQSVKEIDDIRSQLNRIPVLSHLIVPEEIQGNPLKLILPDENTIESFQYNKGEYEQDFEELDRIEDFLSNNPLINHNETLVQDLKAELTQALNFSKKETNTREIISSFVKEIDDTKEAENLEITVKRQRFEQLVELIKKYIKHNTIFNESLDAISKFKITIRTKKIESMGHTLFIENNFELTKEKFLEVINKLLKTEHVINNLDEITPESFFKTKFKKRDPKVLGYEDFEKRIQAKFVSMDKKSYKIITNKGKDFEELSAGWKTSVILDLILGWGDDTAPLIIDQPEDNLATNYINSGLLKAIKECKSKKQIILVSHNATIPMLGDAQNVIVCYNDDNKITIRSNPLEGVINEKDVVDLIAEITDGGKSSIKKRVKKYNLKNFREEHEAGIQKR